MSTTTSCGLDRTVTELDFVRLSKLAHLNAPPWVSDLLDGVDILDAREVPSDTVTMYSKVECQDMHTGHRQQLTVCYPNDADPAAGLVSVLSPVGCGLLGLRAGDVARWTLPSGEAAETQVVSVLFQPEASGNYTL